MRAIGGPGGEASSTVTSRWARAGLAIAGIMSLVAATELAMGRSAICRCGRVALWAGDVRSAENSQQLADWYSLSHVVHGLLLFAASWLALRRWPVSARLVLAVALEAAWEVLENSPAVIARYRATTISWGYAGDSVMNSIGDIAFMTLGFGLAARLSTRAAITLGITLEIVALVAIRDGLALNLLMLAHPIAAVRAWQAAG